VEIGKWNARVQKSLESARLLEAKKGKVKISPDGRESNVGTIFVVQINWPEVIRGTFIPTISFKGEYLAALIAVHHQSVSPILAVRRSSRTNGE
jgi:hypothetical protein